VCVCEVLDLEKKRWTMEKLGMGKKCEMLTFLLQVKSSGFGRAEA